MLDSLLTQPVHTYVASEAAGFVPAGQNESATMTEPPAPRLQTTVRERVPWPQAEDADPHESACQP